jgi:hypothetical protein
VSRTWKPIIARARELAYAFETRFGRPPTLRRLHYELVSDPEATGYGYRNTRNDYSYLSGTTAEGRRQGSFPDLSENVRSLSQMTWFEDADDLRKHIREIARLDRMQGQEQSICLCVEKDGSRGFLTDWFMDYGVLITSLNGYASQTLLDKIARWQYRDGRPMVMLYAGDHDASGEDIDRVVRLRLPPEIEIKRVALLPEHVATYGLPQSPFDKLDSRAASFIARHGGIWQTELDALDPDDLRALFDSAFEDLWNHDAYQERIDAEADLLEQVLRSDRRG